MITTINWRALSRGHCSPPKIHHQPHRSRGGGRVRNPGRGSPLRTRVVRTRRFFPVWENSTDMVKTPEKPRSEFPPPSKRPRGRPGHQPTPLLRRFVTTLSAHGVPHTDIGLALGISARTLRQHYRAETRSWCRPSAREVSLGTCRARQRQRPGSAKSHDVRAPMSVRLVGVRTGAAQVAQQGPRSVARLADTKIWLCLCTGQLTDG